MTAASNEVAAVIQADRDAAADYALASEPNDTAFPYDVRRGYLDKAPVVQAFARHRIAYSDPRPVAEGLREAERIQTLEAALASVRVNLMRDPSRGEAVGEFAAAILRGSTLIEAMISADTRFPAATHSPAPMAGEGWEGPAYEYGVTWGPDEAHPDRLTNARDQGIREAADAVVAYAKRMNDAGKEASFVDAHRAIIALSSSLAAAHPSTQEGSR